MNIKERARLLLRRPTIVCITSTMRSGSTLLKSLIATAPDTSDLPEVNFQQYKWYKLWKVKLLSEANIIVLKMPRAFHHTLYPLLPEYKRLKTIVLVRDVYETVESLSKMNQEIDPDLKKKWSLDKLANTYWYETNNALLNIVERDSLNTLLVKYEDLISKPIEITEQVFNFIGSKQKYGVEFYSKPKNYIWKWGCDDGGEKIKTLKVQNSNSKNDISKATEAIELDEKTTILRKKLGYI